jgi:uncharacterized BrkB/YihY/UPF0761 family membrane protein
MTRKLDIERNLDRSLAKQVKTPRLDHRFDEAVWARIGTADQSATHLALQHSKSQSPTRWLFISNFVGVLVTILLVGIFGLQSFTGVSVDLPTPEISAATAGQIFEIAGWTITVVAVVFGLLFTPVGRRLRAELG